MANSKTNWKLRYAIEIKNNNDPKPEKGKQINTNELDLPKKHISSRRKSEDGYHTNRFHILIFFSGELNLMKFFVLCVQEVVTHFILLVTI